MNVFERELKSQVSPDVVGIEVRSRRVKRWGDEMKLQLSCKKFSHRNRVFSLGVPSATRTWLRRTRSEFYSGVGGWRQPKLVGESDLISSSPHWTVSGPYPYLVNTANIVISIFDVFWWFNSSLNARLEQSKAIYRLTSVPRLSANIYICIWYYFPLSVDPLPGSPIVDTHQTSSVSQCTVVLFWVYLVINPCLALFKSS